jgi:hypothetical protein
MFSRFGEEHHFMKIIHRLILVISRNSKVASCAVALSLLITSGFAQSLTLISQPDHSVNYTGVYASNMSVVDTYELWGAATAAVNSSQGMPVYVSLYLGYQGTLLGTVHVDMQQWNGSVVIVGSATIVPSAGNPSFFQNIHLTNAGNECTVSAGSYYWLHIYSSNNSDSLLSYGGAPYYNTDTPPLFVNNIYQVVSAIPPNSGKITITQQPQQQTVYAGSNVNFSVIANGLPAPNYQWQFNGLNIYGQTATSLSLNNVQFANAGGYSVVITNAFGSVTSTVAQLTVYTNMVFTQTNRTPTTEIGQPTIPTDPTHFKVYTNGNFVSGIALNPNKNTVVLTHGWNGSPNDWAAYSAQIIQQRIGVNAVNIVAWDWTADAYQPDFSHLTDIAGKTPGEGTTLGANLIAALGANYTQRIHFVGHSLGTLVNAAAANYVHGHGFSWTNTQMTLCDEAEIAWGVGANGGWQFATTLPATLVALIQNTSTTQSRWGQALPNQFAWADNYITACGLLHPEAAYAILTYEYPVAASDVGALKTNFFNFHDYAHYFYEDSIEPSIYNTGGQINPTYLGFICSWEGGGSSGRQATNTYYYQDNNSLELHLVQTNFASASAILNARLANFLGTGISTAENISPLYWAAINVGQSLGQVTGIQSTGGIIINLLTSFGGSTPLLQSPGARPMGGPVPMGGGSGNTPAYAWIPLTIPSNTVSMSFDFMVQGNGNQDSFQVAINGTNILSLETVLIQTNVTLNTGLMNVSQYAGQQVQLFLGIVGGSSTNAALTASDFQFYSVLPPSLHIQLSGTNVVLTWPLSGANYAVQYANQLVPPVAWTPVKNSPVIVNFQYTITNILNGSQGYYQLNQSQ